MGSGVSSAHSGSETDGQSDGNGDGRAERTVLGVLAARSRLSARAHQYRVATQQAHDELGDTTSARRHHRTSPPRLRSALASPSRRPPLTPPVNLHSFDGGKSSPFSPNNIGEQSSFTST